jgi:hypothetical protein
MSLHKELFEEEEEFQSHPSYLSQLVIYPATSYYG